jgi:hypothetical protein
MCISHISHACYTTHQSHPPLFDLPNNIWWSVQVMKLLIMQSSPASRHFLPLRSKYSSLSPSQRPSVCVFHLVWETKLHTVMEQQVKSWFCIF